MTTLTVLTKSIFIISLKLILYQIFEIYLYYTFQLAYCIKLNFKNLHVRYIIFYKIKNALLFEKCDQKYFLNVIYIYIKAPNLLIFYSAFNFNIFYHH